MFRKLIWLSLGVWTTACLGLLVTLDIGKGFWVTCALLGSTFGIGIARGYITLRWFIIIVFSLSITGIAAFMLLLPEWEDWRGPFQSTGLGVAVFIIGLLASLELTHRYDREVSQSWPREE